MNRTPKVDGRACRLTMEPVFGKMVGTTEETPAPAGTGRGRDQLGKGVDVTNRTQVRSEQRARIAVDYLKRATNDLETAARQRLAYMRIARRHGLTYQEIAEACGVSDTAVRRLLKRHGGDA